MANLSNINNKFLVTTGGNVGINSTNPGQKLEVIGNIGTSGSVLFNDNQGINFGNSNAKINGSSADGIKFFGSGSEKMRLTQAGNVGIGTASPAAKLNIAGDVLINSGEYISWGTVGATSIEGSTASNKIQFRTNSTNAMIINSSQNVGIGTTSPAARLHVQNSASDGIIVTTSTNAEPFIAMQRNSGSNGVGVLRLFDTGDLAFDTGATGAGQSTKMIITDSGNVGIGTTSPNTYSSQTTLTINGSNYGRLDLESGGTLRSSLFSQAANTTLAVSTGFFSLDTGGTERMRIANTLITFPTVTELRGDIGSNKFAVGNMGDASSQMMVSSRGFITFNTSNTGSALDATERMRIEAAGNVGIGTASPNEKLQVFGNIHAFAPSGIDAGLFASTAASSTTIAIRSNGVTHFNGGNVGILTTTPSSKLTVSGGDSDLTGVNNSIRLENHTSANASPGQLGNGIVFAQKWWSGSTSLRVTGGIFGVKNAGDGSFGGGLAFYTQPSSSADMAQHMVIISTGNVGIGTNSPGNKLVVRGPSSDATGGDGNVAQFEGPSGTNGFQVYVNDTLNNTGIQTKNGDSFIINPGGGNVGIGTTLPESLLHIKGQTRAYISFEDTSDGYIGFIGDAANMLTSGTVDNLGVRGEAGIQFGVSDVIKMVLNSSGNLGIGTTSPTAKITLADHTTPAGGIKFRTAATSISLYAVGSGTLATTGSFELGSRLRLPGGNAVADPDINFTGATAGTGFSRAGQDITFVAGGSERMRITSDGDVLIGATAERGKLTINSSATSGNSNALGIYAASDGGTHPFAQFLLYGTSTVVGGITSNGTTTSYNETSDYRLKEDLQDFNGLDKVSKIPVYDFKWKADESRSYGVMAHELQEVLPQAVVGDKDAEEMQGVDYSKIVPLLVKSIQELEAKIKILENK